MVLTDQIADNDASSGENSDEGDCDSQRKSRSVTESLIKPSLHYSSRDVNFELV